MAEGFVRNRRYFPKATGGTETVIEQDGKFYRVHTYTDVGEDSLEVLRGGEVEYLVVAGGGAGGGQFHGGGGGAGGYRSSVAGEISGGGASAEARPVLAPGTYPVTVGAGGIYDPSDLPAGDGNASSVFGISSVGGGRGGDDGADGRAGGSGGGSAGGPLPQPMPGAGTESQGFVGGGSINTSVGSSTRAGGGGGGASEVGETRPPVDNNAGGKGGDGVETSITGTLTYFAGGGGAGGGGSGAGGIGGLGGGGNGGLSSAPSGLPGTPNTGGGGGGARTNRENGGNGGSGIVIVRYRITQAEFNAA